MEAETLGTTLSYISTEDTLRQRANRLINYSHKLLIEQLERYGNTPTLKHRQALRDVLSLYTDLALGYSSGRYAVPLGTGLGKTQTIIAWATSWFHLGEYGDISLAVCASQVEALCDIKRALIKNGVPEDSIGLWHSYDYDKQKAESYRNGDKQELEKGYASEPCTQDHQSKQILLMTHNRMRGSGDHNKKDTAAFNTFKGQRRSLIIWDESLFVSDGMGVETWKIEATVAALEKKPDADTNPLLKFLRECLPMLELEEWDQEEGKPSSVWNINRSVKEMDILKEYIPRGLFENEILTFLDMCRFPLRLYRGQQSSVITYIPVVDPALRNIVILDASHEIRKLCQINKDIKKLEVSNRGLVTYDSVTIHQLYCPSGRYSLEKPGGYTHELEKTDSGVLKEPVLVIKERLKVIPKDEGILLLTFKQHPRGKDHIKALRRSLKKNDIDPDEMILVNEGGKQVRKRRINFLTWGNETSLNRFSYCSTVILVGILHQNPAHLASSIAGERQALMEDIPQKMVDEVGLSEICHCCQCRFKMSPFCRNKMSPDCRFHSERFSGSGCSSSPFGEGPNMPALRFSLSR